MKEGVEFDVGVGDAIDIDLTGHCAPVSEAAHRMKKGEGAVRFGKVLHVCPGQGSPPGWRRRMSARSREAKPRRSERPPSVRVGKTTRRCRGSVPSLETRFSLCFLHVYFVSQHFVIPYTHVFS